MPKPVQTVAEFLKALADSQLLSASSLQQIDQQVSSASSHLAVGRLAKALLNVGVLTHYQIQRILSGRKDGFYLGPFKLYEVLGRGGMGTVYLAEQTTRHRLVALKVITNVSDCPFETRVRFRREGRISASLSHPNLTQAYDSGEIDGVPYIAMEYVEGFDAAEVVEQYGRLPWPRAADVILQAALGLEHIRLHCLVHRDIKPANLLIATNGVVKVLDLGLCLPTNESHDSVWMRDLQVGTIDYMAPEQAVDCHAVDSRADIYSLGCVFYALLAGQVPFPASCAAQKLLKHQTASPRPIHQHRRDLPTPISDIILTMMEKRPADRFQTPGIVAEALKPWAERTIPPFPLESVERHRRQLAAVLRRSPFRGRNAQLAHAD